MAAAAAAKLTMMETKRERERVERVAGKWMRRRGRRRESGKLRRK